MGGHGRTVARATTLFNTMQSGSVVAFRHGAAPSTLTSMAEADLPSQRYKELVAQMKAELRGAYGWKAKVAETLGIAPSYVAKIDGGDAGQIGPKIVARAIERMGLPREWFYDPDFVPSDHKMAVDAAFTRDATKDVRKAMSSFFEKLSAMAFRLVSQHAHGALPAADVRSLAVLMAHHPAFTLAQEVEHGDDDFAVEHGLELALAVLSMIPIEESSDG